MIFAGPRCCAEDRGKVPLSGDTDSRNAWFPFYPKFEAEVSLPSSAYQRSDRYIPPQLGSVSSQQQQQRLPHGDHHCGRHGLGSAASQQGSARGTGLRAFAVPSRIVPGGISVNVSLGGQLCSPSCFWRPPREEEARPEGQSSAPSRQQPALHLSVTQINQKLPGTDTSPR